MRYELIAPMVPGLSPVEQVLLNRGIKKEDMKHYINTTEDDILDPLLANNMREGVEMLIKHIKANDHILVQVDSDCDGYTSAAVLINYLNRLFPSFVQNKIHYRMHDEKVHGLIEATIHDVKMVIAPDSSSNDYEVHKDLKEKGIDVLVIDHHNAEMVSPYACVINNQLDNYPTKSLSGVGMVFKFCSYIDRLMGTDYADDFRDLTALGLIADMMDTKAFETHHLIVTGLENVKSPLFQMMLDRDKMHFNQGLNYTNVAFYIAPYINAVTRVGTDDEKLLLFESMLEFRANELIPSTKRGCKGQVETRVEQAARTCTNIKRRQTDRKDEGMEYVESIIINQHLDKDKVIIIKIDPDKLDKNLSGYVANQVMGKYQRPVLILRPTEDKEGVKRWEGSGRGYDKSDLRDFRGFLLDMPETEYAEGHNNAFGFGVKDDNFESLHERIEQELANFEFIPRYDVDFIYQASAVSPESVFNLANFEMTWGKGVEKPYVAIENIKVNSRDIAFMGANQRTVKITLPNDIELIKFNIKDEEKALLQPEAGVITLNIVGQCDRNEFNGRVSAQIKMEDYEIVNRVKWDF